jgi:hypothetical protein
VDFLEIITGLPGCFKGQTSEIGGLSITQLKITYLVSFSLNLLSIENLIGSLSGFNHYLKEPGGKGKKSKK